VRAPYEVVGVTDEYRITSGVLAGETGREVDRDAVYIRVEWDALDDVVEYERDEWREKVETGEVVLI
jgi:hypothetical protein